MVADAAVAALWLENASVGIPIDEAGHAANQDEEQVENHPPGHITYSGGNTHTFPTVVSFDLFRPRTPDRLPAYNDLALTPRARALAWHERERLFLQELREALDGDAVFVRGQWRDFPALKRLWEGYHDRVALAREVVGVWRECVSDQLEGRWTGLEQLEESFETETEATVDEDEVAGIVLGTRQAQQGGSAAQPGGTATR